MAQPVAEQAVSLHRPDMIWVIRGNGFTPGLLSQLKARYGVRHTLGWWVKSPRDNPDEMRNDRLEYDAFACIYPGQADPERVFIGCRHWPASPVCTTCRPARSRCATRSCW